MSVVNGVQLIKSAVVNSSVAHSWRSCSSSVISNFGLLHNKTQTRLNSNSSPLWVLLASPLVTPPPPSLYASPFLAPPTSPSASPLWSVSLLAVGAAPHASSSLPCRVLLPFFSAGSSTTRRADEGALLTSSPKKKKKKTAPTPEGGQEATQRDRNASARHNGSAVCLLSLKGGAPVSQLRLAHKHRNKKDTSSNKW